MKKEEILLEIEEIRKLMGNVHISSHTVWNTEQIKDLIERYDKQNDIIKMEITHAFEPGKKAYNVIIWFYPPILNNDPGPCYKCHQWPCKCTKGPLMRKPKTG